MQTRKDRKASSGFSEKPPILTLRFRGVEFNIQKFDFLFGPKYFIVRLLNTVKMPDHFRSTFIGFDYLILLGLYSVNVQYCFILLVTE